MEVIIILAVIAILLVIVISNIYVVQQSRAYVIERLGAFHAVQGKKSAVKTADCIFHLDAIFI